MSLKSTTRKQRHNREDNEYEHCIVSQNHSFTIRQIRNGNIYLSFKVGRHTLSQGAACPAGRCGVEAYNILTALNLGCMLSLICYSFTLGQVTLIVFHGWHHNIISQGAQSQCHRNWEEPDQESPTCSSGRSHLYSRL